MFSKLMKAPLLNIADYEKTDLILFIQIMLIVIVLKKVSLFNTQSLKRHAADISSARRLTKNNIHSSTESQITNYTDVAEIKEQLNTFETSFK